RYGWEVPFELRLGLGQLAADARPLPADWALAWLRLHPPGGLRTPATRRPAGRGLPDVAGLSAPLARLREIAGAACDDLDAYSRYLGRHPDGAGTAAALALLPPGI